MAQKQRQVITKSPRGDETFIAELQDNHYKYTMLEEEKKKKNDSAKINNDKIQQ